MPSPAQILTPEQIAALNALVQGAGVDPWEGEPPMAEEPLPPRSGVAKELPGDVAADRYDQAPPPPPPPDPLDELPQAPQGMAFNIADDSVDPSDPVGSVIRPDAQQNADRLQRGEVDNMVARERQRMAQEPLPEGVPQFSVAEYNSADPVIAGPGEAPGAVPAREREEMARRAGEVAAGGQGGVGAAKQAIGAPPDPASVAKQLQERPREPSPDLQQAQRRTNILTALQAIMGTAGMGMSMVNDPVISRTGAGMAGASRMLPSQTPMNRYNERQAEAIRDREALDMKQASESRRKQTETQARFAATGEESQALKREMAEMNMAEQGYELDQAQRSTDPTSEESQAAQERVRTLFDGLDDTVHHNLPDDFEGIIEGGSAATLAPYEDRLSAMLAAQDRRRRGRGGTGGNRGRRAPRSRGNTPEEIRGSLPGWAALIFDALSTEQNADIAAGADLNTPENQSALQRQREIAEVIETAGPKATRSFISRQLNELRDNEREHENAAIYVSMPGVAREWRHQRPGSRSARYHEDTRLMAGAASLLDNSMGRLAMLRGRITNTDALRAASRIVGAAAAEGTNIIPMLMDPDQWGDVAHMPDDVASYLREFGRVQTQIRNMERTGVPQRFELEDIQRRIPTPRGESAAGSYVNFLGSTPQQLQAARDEYRDNFELMMTAGGYVPGPGRRGRGQIGAGTDAPGQSPREQITVRFVWVDESGQRHDERAPRGSTAADNHMTQVRAARAAGRDGGFVEE